MKQAFLSLGSNLGNRTEFLKIAVRKLKNTIGIEILKESPPLNTAPLEVTDQPEFLNQIIKIETSLNPEELLEVALRIEKEMGRLRKIDKGPREIDIDILSYEGVEINTQALTLPHHSLLTRPFIREILESIGEQSLYEHFARGKYEKHT
ncbi:MULTISPECIES: 2-amino-4-hydroxy-6-hydroxymethyldihydropteridine diphosphokinase [Leptospira]|uniref:2-amino-4-hydroxy-6-hydroxymethyldihydropteridine pyrophosphokinase n=1 Tax=Leptospira kirschneri str. 200802841 TaxID=1193047 RepID=A0A828XYA3_9LEPT|nr:MULTISPECIES: 2-amino-4-hydroxy-6-hydroxymethyldihydropteridine diphosphokinase [Leptospira]EMO76460.1 2-amino-4-hydroxy-6-hydroxymethyldihydropteridine diphosphokinase [Leptospira kirschneri str. 200801925]EJO70949.1 2-amino-4-hydroxy-6-hydroxymethyldihydropteridine diphosphokinase [Leptospira kirschneri serovar Grippotyphosa str. RM52]EKO52577.1 2-amino-4-hydroxy-6-hydroxymethyldihydropteridine diphosphokinase [Leptospira kirschneri str. 200802841]EKQ83034.1 2-amino-4-hydroxy-6-hydroxymeth